VTFNEEGMWDWTPHVEKQSMPIPENYEE